MGETKNFAITVDLNCDLPEGYIKEHDIGVMALSFTLDDVHYRGDSGEISPEAFYKRMREGSMPQTNQVNPTEAIRVFEEYLSKGMDILHIGFSSGLSGSYHSAALAASEILEEYPERTIVTVDSLCASLGMGLLIYKAVQKRDEGMSLEDTASWLEENKLKVCHYFTVDDLNHLYRGGRVSKATAVVGTLLGIKPVLHVDNEGKLVPISKARGRKQALLSLVSYMEKLVQTIKNDVVMISHGDCLEDANFVKEQIRARFGIENVMINFVGPTIGAHSGPGTIALFFMGAHR